MLQAAELAIRKVFYHCFFGSEPLIFNLLNNRWPPAGVEEPRYAASFGEGVVTHRETSGNGREAGSVCNHPDVAAHITQCSVM